jgi:hypothetical protein
MIRNSPGRLGSAGLSLAVSAGLLLLLTATAGSAERKDSTSGKLVVKGKPFQFTRAWLVRGPETSDETKPAAYLILSAQDLSGAITACQTLSCVLWDTVHEAAILEPLDEAAQSFWLRVVSSQFANEYQLSGRRWIPSVQTHDRLAGKLQYSYANTHDEANLEIDATLLKEFPLRPKS